MKYSIIICLLVMICGCEFGERVNGNGNIAKESRHERGFSGLKIGGSMDLELTQGNEYAIEIETDENLLPYIVTERQGDDLHIGYRDNVNINSHHGIKIWVTMPEINHLDLGGSGSIKSNGRLVNDEKIKISVAGSGDMRLQVKTPTLSAHIAGAGKFDVEGETRNVDLHIAGSGDFLGKNLLSENVKISVSGSGKAEVYASKDLDVSVAGSGDVYYRGDPNIRKSIAGSGSIQRLK